MLPIVGPGFRNGLSRFWARDCSGAGKLEESVCRYSADVADQVLRLEDATVTDLDRERARVFSAEQADLEVSARIIVAAASITCLPHAPPTLLRGGLWF